MTLDDKFLSFHNMRDLKYLEIKACCNLVCILLKTFGYLTSLKSLKIENCKELPSSDEDLMPSNDDALLSLESLSITKCGITGKWLSVMLRQSPTLKELYLDDCPQLTQLQIEDDKNIQSNLTSASEALSSGHLDGSRKGFAGFTNLEKLKIWDCPKLLSSLVHNDGQENGRWFLSQSLEELNIFEYFHETLRPCFVDNLTRLKKLEVGDCPYLKSLQLESCTMMGYLRICRCSSLAAIEGLQALKNLTVLNVVKSPVLASLATSGEGYECSQLSGLEALHISELSPLTTSFCKGLSSLRMLSLEYLEEPRLTEEQERALVLCVSLQKLIFVGSSKLLDLPAGLHSLHSLKTLKIIDCDGISGLPNVGLPPLLEELEIESCSYELSAECRSLAIGRLRVKIDGHYV